MSVPASLPGFLRPRAIDSLIRIGRDYDGGYLIDARNLDAADHLIGLGINDDWSFEANFVDRRPVPIDAFDGSVGHKDFTKAFLKSLQMLESPRKIARRARTLVTYGAFFKGDRRHHRRFVGTADSPDFVTVTDLMDRYIPANARALFVKADIEGWEYRILDDLIVHAERIEGLAIEFHDVDLHIDRIRSFVAAFPLHLIHTHANNYAPVTRAGLPVSIECSFTRHPVGDGLAAQFPHPLDMPNKKSRPDIPLTFTG